MVATILDRYITPQIEEIRVAFEESRSEISYLIGKELSEQIFVSVAATQDTPNPPSLTSRLFGSLFGKRKQEKTPASESREVTALANWQNRLLGCKDPLERTCLDALVKVVSGILGHRGRLLGDQDMIANLATNLVCNSFGSIQVGKSIEPVIEKAVEGERYRVLPAQEKPVVMNVKGASASGKSTIRPQQRKLAEKIGIPWEDFALISPDYWRKFLLDYDSLGENYKYAAMLTGQELEIIDKKLDRYMADKASRGAMSHLLIDRFRFDSFTLDPDRSSDSRLLTRFGDLIFMFFMITPPGETVARAWERGLKTGRYKAVDDLLYHNVEAYTGIPNLFFSWVLSKEKRVHFEFLDNDVPEGELPRTAAFGWNRTMTILDINLMVNIDRYRKVDIEAQEPAGIFDRKDMVLRDNTTFMKRCAELIPDINFADQETGYVYARMNHGKMTWCDAHYVENLSKEPDVKESLEAFGFWGAAPSESTGLEVLDLEAEKNYTLGRWGVHQTN
ncbi:hypothetical protein [Pelagibius sp. Alg239-R121]|uniref:hypothetical protein n=1 Tax=Pelagibius sp. Alg239-R121 TaxID=2993448 RepID=UPI0024A71B77|nr:hypothetical protein [Pelagibius sp. Alg239-R121]